MDYTLEQSPTEIDGLTLEGLRSRYSMSRSQLSDRIKKLRDRGYPINLDKRLLYSPEDIATLDELHSHLSMKGATIANFSPYGITAGLSRDSPATTDISTPVLIELVSAIAHAMRPPADPLTHLEQLQRASEAGWLLSTSDVRNLIGVTPSHGCSRYGFDFEKAGKNGRETAWRVRSWAAPI
jgi:biotin operon repressor